MKISVHGHRGARAHMPENTLAGFEFAIRHGADAVEMDLVVTKESEVVVSHDPVLERGSAPTLDQVGQALSPANVFLDLEIKTWPGCPPPEELARLVLEKIHAYKLENRVAILSFAFPVLRAMRALAPKIRLGALTEDDPRDFPEIAREAAGAEIVTPEFHLVTVAKVAAAHAARLQVVPWTVNAPTDWDRMIAAKVDGIITDDPVALKTYLAQRTS